MSKPLTLFRVHLTGDTAPVDVEARDPNHARSIVKDERPGAIIKKIKVVRS